MKGKRRRDGESDGDLGILENQDELLAWALTAIGPALVVGGLMWLVARWRWWPLAGSRRLARWTWGGVIVVPAFALLAAAISAGEVRAAVAAGSAAIGAIAGTIAAWDGERFDRSSPQPTLRRRVRRRIGPVEALRARLGRSAFASRPVPYIERERGSEDVALGVGLNDRREVEGLTEKQLMRCGLLVGASGSGKSWTAHAIAQASVLGRGLGLVWCEAKAEGETLDRLAALALRAGRAFWVFDIHGQGQLWNPLGVASSAGARRDLLFRALEASFGDGSEYYATLFREHAYMVFRGLELAGREPTIRNVREHWSSTHLGDLVDGIDGGDADSIREHCAALDDNRQRREAVEGVGGRVNELDDAVGEQLRPALAGEEEIKLSELMESGAICLFRLEAQSLPEASRSLGQLLLADLAATCGPIITERRSAECMVVLDEFGRYSGPALQPLMALTARAAAMPILIATQDVSDLRAVGDQFLEQNAANLGWVFAGLTNEPESADYLARFSGQKMVVEWTRQTQKWEGDFDHESGQGTQAHGYEWNVHPSEFQALNTGRGALIRKGPQASAVIEVFAPMQAAELMAEAPAPSEGWSAGTLRAEFRRRRAARRSEPAASASP